MLSPAFFSVLGSDISCTCRSVEMLSTSQVIFGNLIQLCPLCEQNPGEDACTHLRGMIWTRVVRTFGSRDHDSKMFWCIEEQCECHRDFLSI